MRVIDFILIVFVTDQAHTKENNVGTSAVVVLQANMYVLHMIQGNFLFCRLTDHGFSPIV